jgi:hypothetical protein
MPAPTEIRFTALPNGFTEAGNAKIFIFVSLMAPGAYPDGSPSANNCLPPFLRPWPTTADALEFMVDVRDAGGVLQGNSYQVQKLPADPATVAQATWDSIFTSGTWVKPRTAGPPVAGVQTYDVDGVGSDLDIYHQAVANSSSQTDIDNAIGQLGQVQPINDDLHRLSDFHEATPPIIHSDVYTDPAHPGTQYNILAEFHSRLTGLLQYPSVMRSIRLVIEAEVLGLTPQTMPPAGSLAAYISMVAGNPVAAKLTDPNVVSLVYPWVAYETSPPYGLFSPSYSVNPAPKFGPFGIVHLDSSAFYATTWDLDGAGLGLKRHIVDTHKGRPDKSFKALPNRRGKGIQIFDLTEGAGLAGLVSDLKTAHQAASNHPTRYPNRPDTQAPLVDWRHVMRGYRIDVRTEPQVKARRSLCERKVSVPSVTDYQSHIEDAAVVPPGLSTPSMAAPAGDLHKSSQLLFGWNDWSLVVPRPTRKPIPNPPPDSVNPVKVEVIPHTHLRMRYGTTYAFRARAVDVAGNGCTLRQADFVEPSDAWRKVQFLRRDVIPAPDLIVPYRRTSAADPADDQSRMLVVRSGGQDKDTDTRYIFAPTANAETARLSGTLDHLSAAGQKARDEALKGTKHFVDPAAAGVVASIDWPATSIAPATMKFRPGGNDELRRILVEENRKIRLTLAKGDQMALIAKEGGYAIEARVPPGHVATLMLRTLISPSSYAQLELRGVPINELQTYGFKYSNLAGPRQLTLIHASEKPIVAPAFDTVDPGGPVGLKRTLGKTAVHFCANNVSIDVESTGQLDLQATWAEVLDQVATDGSWPAKQPNSFANLASTSVNAPAGHPWARKDLAGPVNVIGVHDFGDTKARELKDVYLIAISRFANFFDAPQKGTASDPMRFARRSKPTSVVIRASAAPPPPQVKYIVPTIGRSYPSGDDAHWSRTTEVWGLRVYLQRGWFASGGGETVALVLKSTDQDENTVSHLGSDPARSGDTIYDRLNAHQFHSGVNVQNVLRPKNTSAVPPPSGSDPNDHFDIMSFPVFYDSAQNLLYADVVFEPQQAYRPFLRMALARYQAYAQDTAQLSTTVTADYIQVGPARTLSVARAGETLSVAVSGIGTDHDPAAAYLQNAVIVVSQRKRRQEDPWIDADRTLLTANTTTQGVPQVWTGNIARTHDSYNRIVVEELEYSLASLQNAIGQTVAEKIEEVGRLVYTDQYEY